MSPCPRTGGAVGLAWIRVGCCGGTTHGVSDGEVRWRDGRRRRGRATRHQHRGVPVVDASAPPPPFLDRVHAGAVPTMSEAGRLLLFRPWGGRFGPKPMPFRSWGVWMEGGGPCGGSRVVRWRNVRLKCGRAAMAMWVAWMLVFGVAWVCRKGVSAGVHNLSGFTGRRWRHPRMPFPFLKAPSLCSHFSRTPDRTVAILRCRPLLGGTVL